jgi:predicted CXXCH cytochrome family protein
MVKTTHPKRLLFSIIINVLVIVAFSQAQAQVTGLCSNCHTMHNSQGGAEMATYGGGTGANPCLTRGDCIGCHAYNTSGTDNVVNIGGSLVPQVFHDAATDLSGGNFKYISTAAGANDNKGHNVAAINVEGTITGGPPGDQESTGITTDLTCAGVKGCHGDRDEADETASIKGAHHAGVSGLCNTASTVANSYRFLKGVKGYENMDATYKYQNYNSQYHNEYYGVSNRGSEGTISSPGSNSISGLCAECHGHFHGTLAEDIGTASPWLRHPTDIVLTNSGEYTSYTTYSIVAPVARPALSTINAAGNSVVTPGTDVVMCLSCHGAHATNYYKLMRWDNKANMSGCIVCHTSKN